MTTLFLVDRSGDIFRYAAMKLKIFRHATHDKT